MAVNMLSQSAIKSQLNQLKISLKQPDDRKTRAAMAKSLIEK